MSADIFKNQFFEKKQSFGNPIRVSNSLYPDQARRFVGPDLGPNCLQWLSPGDTCCQRVKCIQIQGLEAKPDDVTTAIINVV